METTAIYIAGIGNSGSEHWQRIWHESVLPGTWVEHRCWDYPLRSEWTNEVVGAIESSLAPVVLIAHSLGCLTAIDAAARLPDHTITGAFLVSVPNPTGPQFPDEARGFDEIGIERLPFPTCVVASENDPFGTVEYQRSVAQRLGAQLENVGLVGHINSSSSLVDWPSGWRIFTETLGA